ncbi:MAG: hypothetical protein ACFFAS_19540 [Promethearchaeota archaeon]
MSLRIELLHRYPWLPSLKEYYSDMSEKDPSDFLEDLFTKFSLMEISERVFSIFKAAFENMEQISGYKADELNTYLYLTIKFLLVILDDRILSNRVANLYSKINYAILIQDNYANIYALCQDLNLDLKYSVKPYEYGVNIVQEKKEILQTNFKLHFSDYLELSANLRDDHRRLVNNPLENGYVYVQQKTIARLLQEYVRKKILPPGILDKNSIIDFKNGLFQVPEFQSIYKQINEEWTRVKEASEFKTFSFDTERAPSDTFPPCLQEILTKAREGQNLVHNERLFLVFLLHAINYSVEDIVAIFSNLPDFDENKTLYQVKFALEKNYTPHKCDTLKSLHLCKAKEYKDEICLKGYYSRKLDQDKKISHPLFYISLKQYRNSKSNQDKTSKLNPGEDI